MNKLFQNIFSAYKHLRIKASRSSEALASFLWGGVVVSKIDNHDTYPPNHLIILKVHVDKGNGITEFRKLPDTDI